MKPLFKLAPLGFAIFGLSALVGCQTGPKTVSLTEAKKITATYVGKKIEQPPKNVTGLVEQLKKYNGKDAAKEEKLQKIALSEPSEEVQNNPPALMNFLFERMRARKNLGMAAEALKDNRELIPLVRKFNKDQTPRSSTSKANMIYEAAYAELMAGDFAVAMELAQEAFSYGHKPVSSYTQYARFLLMQGRIEEAEEVLKQLVDFTIKWQNDHHVPRLRGFIAQAKANYADAEKWFGVAADSMSRKRADWTYGAIMMSNRYRARNIARQGRIAEAELLTRAAIQAALKRYNSYQNQEMALHLVELARFRGQGGDFQSVLELTDVATEILDAFNYPKVAWLRYFIVKQKSMAYIALGDTDKAYALMKPVAELFKREYATGYESLFRKDLNRLFINAVVDPSDDDLEDIKVTLETSVARLGDKHRRTAVITAVEGVYHSRKGNHDAAIAAFDAAYKTLSSRSRQSKTEGESNFYAQKRKVLMAESYLESLMTKANGAKGDDADALVSRAFKVASRARGQVVSEVMSSSAARAQFSDPELQELARREQDAQRQIQALYGLLAEATNNGTPDDKLTELRTAIDGLRASRATIFEQIEKRFPDYASLINPKPASPSEVAEKLKSSEALVAFYFTPKQAYAFLVKNGKRVRFHIADFKRSELRTAVKTLRTALDPAAETLGDIPEFNVAVAHKLYQKLLQPFEKDLTGITNLFVVPHDDLWQIPVQVLVTSDFKLEADNNLLFEQYRNVPWLANKYAVAALPAENIIVNQRSSKPKEGEDDRILLAAFGDPLFGLENQETSATKVSKDDMTARGGLKSRGAALKRRAVPQTRSADSASLEDLPQLPDTLDEVNSIALALNANIDGSLFTGTEASEANVKSQDLSNRRFLVFATHGLTPGELDGLGQPALALTNPRITGSKEDGLLTTSEILGLRLDADMVVLSACNTAAANGAGSEAISGLGAAFFYAGAKSILVTGWPVETTSAKLLTTTMFGHFAGNNQVSPMQALQKSSVSLIKEGSFKDDSGAEVFAYAHPIFWAPFFVVGDSQF